MKKILGISLLSIGSAIIGATISNYINNSKKVAKKEDKKTDKQCKTKISFKKAIKRILKRSIVKTIDFYLENQEQINNVVSICSAATTIISLGTALLSMKKLIANDQKKQYEKIIEEIEYIKNEISIAKINEIEKCICF